MISLRLAVPAVLVAAALAGCFTYFVAPLPQIEADRLSPQSGQSLVPDMSTPTKSDQRLSAGEDAYRQAADAILKKAPDSQASARTTGLPITGHIPLPKRRPIARP